MTRAFKVWDPDDEDEAEARSYSASSPEEAAEKYSEYDFTEVGNSHIYDGREVSLRVRDTDGTLYTVLVTVDCTPVFCGRQVG